MSVSVSIVLPCRNEARFIDRCLESVLATDYPGPLEILVIDGMSDDGTREAIACWVERDRRLTLVDNPRRTTPAALNLGITRSTGEIVVRMDAHCVYPPNYVSTLVRALLETGADNVGTVCETRPADVSARAAAIALGLSHPFGVGNSWFRVGVAEPRWVDTVPFGCWRRDLFARVGPFDEELARNQDDEFNHRLLRRGGRVLLLPEPRVRYFARGSLAALWGMYWQYGYFKPLVARKVGGIVTARQLGPAALVLAFVALGAAAVFSPAARLGLVSLGAVYGLACGLSALHTARRSDFATLAWLALVFPVLHASYGLGYLRGLFDFVVRRRRAVPCAIEVAPSR
jgi:glycosyltransferase involved in cell wall biosynthesis